MGITPNYRGYDYIVLAIELVFENPARLQHVTKELYPEVAKQYHTDWRAVEHSIRIAILRSWEGTKLDLKDYWECGKKKNHLLENFLPLYMPIC